jgi:hypothetical protein
MAQDGGRPLTQKQIHAHMLDFDIYRIRIFLDNLEAAAAAGAAVDAEVYTKILHDFDEALQAYAAHFPR